MRYSIIIPHYGMPDLLQRLLRSIPQRDDLEVIVEEDDMQRGAGWARNQAMRKAKGDYLIFADSDDEFLPAFNELLDAARNVSDDVIFFSATSKENATCKLSWRACHLNWIMQQEAERCEFLLRHTFTEPWCKLVRRDLVEKQRIVFDETPILNDVHFSTQVGYWARSISVMPIKAYCINNRQASTAKQMDRSRLVAYSWVMANTNMFNGKHGIDYWHARMLRPFVMSVLTLRFSTARECWKVILSVGFANSQLIPKLLLYPWQLISHIKQRKVMSRCI